MDEPPGARRVVLASASPRRRELLERIGLDLVVVPADIDESVLAGGEDPVAYVRRLADAKAAAVPADTTDIVIAADTTVDVDGTILAKPLDANDARRMLKLLSARVHRVHTGVAVRCGPRHALGVATTFVRMVPITDAVMQWYLATGEPMDKAGAYAIQGHGALLVDAVQGSVTNVVGLPMSLLQSLLAELDVSLVDLAGIDRSGPA